MIKNWLHRGNFDRFRLWKKYIVFLKNIFYPLNKIYEIAITGENINDCNQFKNGCENFITEGKLRQYGLEYDYNRKKNIFVIKVDERKYIKIRFCCYELPGNDWNKGNTRGDILVPIFKLDKYQPFEYNCLSNDIGSFLGRAQHYKKIAITALINFDRLLKSPEINVEQWENLINNLYEVLRKCVETKKNINIENEELTENGKKVLNLIFIALQHHISENTMTNAYRIANLFCYNEANDFIFGKQEFFSNLLIGLLSFDKFNYYEYQVG